MLDTFPDTAEVRSGRLWLGGCDAGELARSFGTPLVVLDRATFEARARAYAAAVGAPNVFYAGKAFLCVAVCELASSLGIGLDVCTGGELATARAANFPAERVVLHGNNKSEAELSAALDAGVGRIVVDSFDEIERLQELAPPARLLVRVTPGVEAHTHEFVQTGQEDSKFGFTMASGVALDALERTLALGGERVVGVHAHIGSQIFELAAFELAARRLAELCRQARDRFGFTARELNLGGGLGVAHVEDELTPDPERSARRIVDAVGGAFAAAGLEIPSVAIEPGRSIVGAAGVTLYTVGTIKRIPGVRTYVSVDGGMSDNVRPALYAARYDAYLAERMDAPVGPRVTIAGKHCESGDVLVKDVHLPTDVAPGDLLCVPATGAYTYAMASNYNRVARPAVVMVSEGSATLIVERESVDDLLRLDRRLDGSTVQAGPANRSVT